MPDNFNRTINIYVESGQAQQAYDLLAKKQADLTKQIGTYTAAGKDIPEKLTKQLQGVTEALDRQSKKLTGELSPAYKDLTGTVTRLTSEVSRMSQQDAGFAQKTKELKEAREAADHYKNSVISVGAALHHGKEESEGFAHGIKEIAAGFTAARLVEKGFDTIKDGLKESVQESLKAELAQKQLRNSLEATARTDAFERLNENAEGWSKKFSYLYKPEITEVQTKLIDFGHLSENQMKETLDLIINYAAKKNKTLEESSELVLRSYEGNSRALQTLGIEIKKDAGFAVNYSKVIEQLGGRVQGAADTFDKSGAGSVARYNKELKELQETVGNAILPLFTQATNGLSGFMAALRSTPQFIRENHTAIAALITAYALYRSAIILATIESIKNMIVEKGSAAMRYISAGATTAATVATNIYRVGMAALTGQITLAQLATQAWALATGLASGGLLLVIGGIITAGVALSSYLSKVGEASEAEKALASAREESEKKVEKEKDKLEELLAVARDESLSKERRTAAIKELNEISPEYLGNITLETVNTKAATKAIEEYLTVLQYKSDIEALSNEISKKGVEHIEAQSKSVDESLSTWEKAKIAVADYLGVYGASAQVVIEHLGKEQKGYEETTDALKESLKEKVKALDDFEKNKDKSFHKEPAYAAKEKNTGYEQFYEKIKRMREESTHANDADEMKEIAKLAEKYNTELTTLRKFLKDKHISEQQYQEARKIIMEAYKNDEAGLLGKQNLESNQNEYTTQLKHAEDMFAAIKELNQRRFMEGEMSENAYKGKVAAIDISLLETKRDLANKYTETLEQTTSEQVKNSTKYKEQLIKIKADELEFEKQLDQKATDEFIAQIQRRKAAQEAISKSKQETSKAKAATSGNGKYDETDEKLKAEDERFSNEQVKWADNQEVLDQITAEHQAKRDQIIQEGFKKTMQEVSSDIQKYGAQVTRGIGLIFKAMDSAENSQLRKDKAANSEKIKNFDDQLKRKRISQATHDKLVEAANAEMAKKEDDMKRKQFERNKAMQIINAVINTAVGVTQALANMPPPLSYVMAAVTGVLGAVEIGVIASEQYADGTASFGDKGVIPGQPHSNGGNPVIDPRTGQKIAELEHGEAIIPKDAAANNPEVINYLLTTGRKKGAANNMSTVVPLDVNRSIQNIKLANGGYTLPLPNSPSQGERKAAEGDTQVTQLLTGIKQTLDESKQYHKQTAEKPTLSLQTIQETERQQSFTLSQHL